MSRQAISDQSVPRETELRSLQKCRILVRHSWAVYD